MSFREFAWNGRAGLILASVIFLVASALRWANLGMIVEPIFDEVHYVPAAEVLVGLRSHPGMGLWASHPLLGKSPAPNFEHPLLGKFLIGFGMNMWGNQAWGWRFFSAIFACLSIILMGLVALQLSRNSWSALLAMAFLGFDSMHMLHSRLAMLDIFVHFAVLSLLWSSAKLIENPKDWRYQLCSAGSIAFGLSIKWVFAFAIIGFSWSLLFLGNSSWKERWKALTLVGVVSFGLYNLWFLFYFAHGFSYWEWIDFQRAAAQVTTGSLVQHPYGASALSMLFNIRNIWYYFKQVPGSSITGLVCLINPVLIYGALPALGFIAWNYRQHRRREDAYILGWFACCYLPFFLVLMNRQGFLYYMLMPLPLIVLANCRLLELVKEHKPSWPITPVYLGLFFLVAGFFLPIVLAIPIAPEWYLWIVRFTGI